MFEDFLNLKLYDKKVNSKSALAEIYELLIKEYKSISEYNNMNTVVFSDIKTALNNLESKQVVNKIILFWTSILLYISRVNFLINITAVGVSSGRVKKRDLDEFTEITKKHIDSVINSALNLVDMHISFLYFKYWETQKSSETNNLLIETYLNSFQTAMQVVDKKTSNSAIKITDNYSLGKLIELRCIHKLELLDTYKD